jgi:hypothetical protein
MTSALGLAETFIPTDIGEGKKITVTGWAFSRGELTLYATKKAMKAASRYPECISGLYNHHSPKMIAKFHEKRITVVGIAHNVTTLPDEISPLPRKILNGSILYNFCFAPYALEIQSITPAK